jgi:hypothetical protein
MTQSRWGEGIPHTPFVPFRVNPFRVNPSPFHGEGKKGEGFISDLMLLMIKE